MCLFVVTVAYAQPDSTQKVLILNSYHKEFKWTDTQVSAAKEVLSEGIKDLELFVEYMDTKRIYNKEYLEYLFHIYRLKYKKIQFDAIIATDDNALWFVVKYHKDVFGEAPVTFCGINDYKKSLLEGKQQFTGLVEVLDIKPTIDAYSARFRPPIPGEAGHPFRLIPDTDSGGSRPPIPEHSGHPEQKMIAYSGAG